MYCELFEAEFVNLVMNGAVISRLRHGIFGYYGHAEMPAAGYPGHSFDDKLRGRSVS